MSGNERTACAASSAASSPAPDTVADQLRRATDDHPGPTPPLLARQQRLDPRLSASGTSHGFGTYPKLTTGADGLRYGRTGPFIQLELL